MSVRIDPDARGGRVAARRTWLAVAARPRSVARRADARPELARAARALSRRGDDPLPLCPHAFGGYAEPAQVFSAASANRRSRAARAYQRQESGADGGEGPGHGRHEVDARGALGSATRAVARGTD